MSHQIHHTEGFVLESRNMGEANKIFSIYTKDFGLVRASAQGVRKLESKLRFNLQDYAYLKLDLVQGREIWRLTSAELLSKGTFDKDYFKLLQNFFRLIGRLCRGEEKNEKLFGHLKDIFAVLERENLNQGDLRNFECVSVVRILHSLGYIGGGEEINFFITAVLGPEIIREAGPRRRLLVSEINKSLKESHL